MGSTFLVGRWLVTSHFWSRRCANGVPWVSPILPFKLLTRTHWEHSRVRNLTPVPPQPLSATFGGNWRCAEAKVGKPQAKSVGIGDLCTQGMFTLKTTAQTSGRAPSKRLSPNLDGQTGGNQQSPCARTFLRSARTGPPPSCTPPGFSPSKPNGR